MGSKCGKNTKDKKIKLTNESNANTLDYPVIF